MRPLAMVAAPKIMAAFGLATEPLKRTEPSEPDTTVVNAPLDRKSTRLNSSHSQISYAVFCLKKKPNLLRERSALPINPFDASGRPRLLPRVQAVLPPSAALPPLGVLLAPRRRLLPGAPAGRR